MFYKFFHVANRIIQSRRIAGAVREKESSGLIAQHLFSRGGGRYNLCLLYTSDAADE